MKKCCFLVPYYGKFPAAFPVFLKSCGANPDFDWLFFTDDHTPYDFPANCRVEYGTFDALREKADKRFGFHVRLDEPYKLCDFKPAFGFLFEEYLTDYAFWGHCDIDTVMGCLGNFLTDELLSGYDKLFCLGHMTLYRNTPENNRVFMRPLHGRPVYRLAFDQPKNTWFDEEYKDENNVNQIFLAEGRRVYTRDLSLNVHIGSRRFRRTEYVGRVVSPDGYRLEEPRNACVFWDHGRLIRQQLVNGRLETEEFLYIHLQYRDMEYRPEVLNADVFRIVPDQFAPMRAVPSTPAAFLLTPKLGFSSARAARVLRRVLHLG